MPRNSSQRWILILIILYSSYTLTKILPWRNLNVTLSRDFKCENPQETSLPKINRKNNKRETLHDDILSIREQAISKTKLDMVSHKKILRIHVHWKWDNNNKQNGVQIQVTSEGKLTNYCVKTKHIPNTSSKTKYINEVMASFQHKTRIKRRHQ